MKQPADKSEENRAVAIQLLQTGKFPQAEAAFRNLLMTIPDDVGCFNDLGLSLLYQGKKREAILLYEETLLRFPDVPELHYNLGLAHHRSGDLSKACACYKQATLLRPSYFDAFRNLSAVCLELDQEDSALYAIKKAHEINPEDKAIHFQLLALEGSSPPAPPCEYVTSLFGNYSTKFDHHLTGSLGYAIPQHLRNALGLFLADGERPFLNAIDLGCGTGLAGVAIRDLCLNLTGVDLSAEMLVEARAKGVYNNLVQADLHEALASGPASYDLVIATDVMIYVGALEKVFAMVRQRIAPGGYFCFSLETDTETPTYRLQQTARYAHNPSYAHSLAYQHRFLCRLSLPVVIRKQRNRDVQGELLIFQAQ